MPLLFDLLYVLALLLLLPWLAWRSATTGRYRHGLAAKLLGHVRIHNPEAKPVIWFHGVSVGEIHLLGVVVAAFRKRHPNWFVAVSSTTDTGLDEARKRFADCAVVPFPFDFSWACDNALSAIRPDLVVLAESELWPNFLAVAARRKVPVAVINARMSPRSFSRLKRFAGAARTLLFRHVAAFGVQSAEYAERLELLGVSAEKLTVTGSVKYDGATGERDTPKARELKRLLALNHEALVWVAGSTHAPEESIVLQIFARLRLKFPHLHLILVPRHPDRFAEVVALVAKSGLPFVRRSELEQPASQTPAVVVLDTLGELGAAWAIADVGFTGGSLDGHRGGQSMIEPAGFGVPTLFGPHVWNFRDAARNLLHSGGAITVEDASELEVRLVELLNDPERRKQMGTAARELVRAQQGATERTLDVLDRVLSLRRSGR